MTGPTDPYQEAVCNTGTRQSPVDIVTQAAVPVSPVTVPGLVTAGFEDDISGFLANTGRMLQFAVLGYARPTIEAGPLGDKKYSKHIYTTNVTSFY